MSTETTEVANIPEVAPVQDAAPPVQDAAPPVQDEASNTGLKTVLDSSLSVGHQIAKLFELKRIGEIDIRSLEYNLTSMDIMSSADVKILIKKCVSSKAGELFANFKRDPSREELHELLNHDKKKKFMKYFFEFCEAKSL
jgi:hypothetical protein